MMCSRIIHDAVVLRPLGHSVDLARGVADALQFVVEVITSGGTCKSCCHREHYYQQRDHVDGFPAQNIIHSSIISYIGAQRLQILMTAGTVLIVIFLTTKVCQKGPSPLTQKLTKRTVPVVRKQKTGCVSRSSLRLIVSLSQLDCEALGHLIVRIHEPLCLAAEISSAGYLWDDGIEFAYLRSDLSNCSDESCVDE